MRRECGECTLCCKLLPMAQGGHGDPTAFEKAAGERCQHQRHRKGCAIYGRHPMSCQLWSCRWLVNDDTSDLSRPDRSHYVIDLIPDFITLESDGEKVNIEVVVVWIDPKHPDARHDPALRRYMIRRAEEGKATLVRFNARDAVTIFAPPFDREWHEIKGGQVTEQHSMHDVVNALGGKLVLGAR